MLHLRLAGKALSFAALVIAAFAALVLVVVPLATGSQSYTVLTSSMAPKYSPGTFLVVKPVDFDELRTGDVVTYQLESGKSAVITHRITSVITTQQGQKQLITKGDNNSVEDAAPVQEVQVRGKLFYAVPYVGFAANALGNSERSLWVQLGAVGLVGYGAFTFIRGAVRRKVPAGAAG